MTLIAEINLSRGLIITNCSLEMFRVSNCDDIRSSAMLSVRYESHRTNGSAATLRKHGMLHAAITNTKAERVNRELFTLSRNCLRHFIKYNHADKCIFYSFENRINVAKL